MQPSDSHSGQEEGQEIAIAPCPPDESNAEIQKTDGEPGTSQLAHSTGREAVTSLTKKLASNPSSVDESISNRNFQDGNKNHADSSSENSVLVSLSSCSVSSNDQEAQSSSKEDAPYNTGKLALFTNLNTECENPSQPKDLTSTSSPHASKVNVPLHTGSMSFTKSPPRANENTSKPDDVISKSQLHRTGGKKRSYSIPLHPVASATFPPSPVPSTSPVSMTSKNSNLRRGKWTTEEEAYVARVVQDFNNGLLNAPAGTTLRTYLSDKLNCDPMRITKKFTGDACIGKRVFHPAVRSTSNAIMLDKAQNELETLECRWRRRLDMQKKDAEKKVVASAAASQAAQVAAAASAPHLHDPTSALIRLNASALPGNRVVVAQTASWLDRANAILSNRRNASEEQSKQASQGDEVKKEMQEIEGLIQEGPIIQKSSAGLLIQKYNDIFKGSASKRKVSDDHVNKGDQPARSQSNCALDQSNSTFAGGQKKRLRKSFSDNYLEMAPAQIRADFNVSTGDAEDAASFLGFISSVQKESGTTPAKNQDYQEI